MSNQRGFTLIEILLVVMLLTVIAVFTIPQFGQSYEQLQLKDVTNDIAYIMRYAQSRAIHSTRPLKLMFDAQNSSYWLTQAAPVAEDAAEAETPESGYEKLSGRFGRIFTIPAGMTVQPTNPSIMFNPDGRIEKSQIDVCYKKKCLIISTLNQSGYVAVQEAAEELR